MLQNAVTEGEIQGLFLGSFQHVLKGAMQQQKRGIPFVQGVVLYSLYPQCDLDASQGSLNDAEWTVFPTMFPIETVPEPIGKSSCVHKRM